MPTKRTPLSRPRKPTVTEEMLTLFRTGLEILEQGADQRWEEEGGRRGEYLDLDLRLNIVLLQQAWHESACSILGSITRCRATWSASPAAATGTSAWHRGRRCRRNCATVA
jgi:hypothetical protein